MVYAFARDGGLPGSKYLARVHGKLVVPLNALLFTAALVIVFGCIFLGRGKSGYRSRALNGLLGKKEYPGVSHDINAKARTKNSKLCRHIHATFLLSWKHICIQRHCFSLCRGTGRHLRYPAGN